MFCVVLGLGRMIQCIQAKDIHNDCGADPGAEDKLHAYNDFSLSDSFSYLFDNDVVGRQSGVIPSQGQLQDSVVNQRSDGTHFFKQIPARSSPLVPALDPNCLDCSESLSSFYYCN